MKTRILLGVCAILSAGCLSVGAADNPAQAAARTVLEQKMNELAHPQIVPASAPARLPVIITPSGIVKKSHRLYAANTDRSSKFEVGNSTLNVLPGEA